MRKLTLSLIMVIISINTFSQIQWHQVNGPNGARVNCMAINAHGDLFEGNNFSGGMYRLIEGEGKWEHLFNNISVQDILINKDEILIASEMILKHSSDNGNHWNIIGTFINTLGAICIDTMRHLIYAGPYTLNFTSDSGQTWTETSMPANSDIVIDSASTVYTSSHCGPGIFRSYDSGLTFTSIFPYYKYVSRLGVNSFNEIFAGAKTEGGGVYKSVDGGDTWTEIDSGFMNKIVVDMIIDSKDDIYVLDQEGTIHLSKDRGISWIHYPTDILRPNAIFHDEIHHRIILGSYGDGIYFTGDTINNWTWDSDSLNNSFVYTINQNINGDLYCGTQFTLFKSVDNGDTWEKLNFPIIDFNVINKITFNSSGNVFCCSNEGVYRSLDHGLTWQNINNGIIITQTLDMAISDNDIIFVTDVDHGIFRSIDNGNHWQQLDTINISKSLRPITITKNNTILVGTFLGDTVYRTTDNGNTWNSTNFTGDYIRKLLVLNDSAIIAFGHNGIYESCDDGINWTVKSTENFWDITTDINNVLFGLNLTSLSISYNKGISWSTISGAISNYKPNIIFKSNNNRFFIGTNGNGIYKSDSTVFLSIDNERKTDNSFEVFPNPTSSIIQVAAPMKTGIDILNIKGQIIIKCTVDNITESIDLSGVSAGLYIIRAINDQGITTKKLIKE